VVYYECVELAKEHDEYEDLALQNGHLFNGDQLIDKRKWFSIDVVFKIEELQERLYSVRCVKFQRNNNMLLFYKIGNCIAMSTYPWGSFLPARPGVLYSLSGENPNEISSEVLDKAKPFVKISGDWYMSRKLMLTGPRLNVQTSIPKSLIDHSLKTKGLNLGGGTE